jgi:predicted enzyme related to lactoylglutathione lyase
MSGAATIFVKHLLPLASFYEACFGFETIATAPGDYRVLESAAWTLTIVQVPAETAAAIELSDPPTRREQTPIKLSFEVPSIAAARARITELGGRVDDSEWEFRGFRHCNFVDLEGNVNELREFVS